MVEVSERVKELLNDTCFNETIDEEIDDLVYKLYNISSEERDYIAQWLNIPVRRSRPSGGG